MEPQVAATILHADLDAFYASVEQLLDPSLRGQPIAVGGGVVLAASYEARRSGVRSGMASWRARQLCPRLRFVGGHFSEYQHLGDQVIDVIRDFTPYVERISIDEAFADVAGGIHLFGPPRSIAAAIRRQVRTEIGLALSIGVARTKHLAKVASQVAKPDGLIVVEPDRERAFLDPLPVELLWGVGPATRARLHQVGIHSVGDLAATSAPHLAHLLGRAVGTKLAALATNVDHRSIEAARPPVSMGAQSALGKKEAAPEVLRTVLGYLVDRVAARLRAARLAGRTITVRVRFSDMHAVTRSTTLGAPIATVVTLREVATGLAHGALADHPEERFISLLAVSISNLASVPALQLELPLGLEGDDRRPGSQIGAGRLAVDRSVDRIRARFGREAVGYAEVALSDLGGVPDAFRELAERAPHAD